MSSSWIWVKRATFKSARGWEQRSDRCHRPLKAPSFVSAIPIGNIWNWIHVCVCFLGKKLDLMYDSAKWLLLKELDVNLLCNSQGKQNIFFYIVYPKESFIANNRIPIAYTLHFMTYSTLSHKMLDMQALNCTRKLRPVMEKSASGTELKYLHHVYSQTCLNSHLD